MDVPATAPTELVQAETQPAIDALRRLSTTRDAVARMLEAQPSLRDVSVTGARQVRDALPGFWASADSAGDGTRDARLSTYLASVMREEATLRGLDGTLGEAATSLAARVAAVGDGVLPAGAHASELMVGAAAHTGSLILTDDATPDLALLFTAHAGWEAFDSLDRLLATTRRRLVESVDVADVIGLDQDTFAEAKVDGGIGSRPIAGNIFTTLAERMVDVRIARIALAIDDHELDRDDPASVVELADRIRYELSATAMLDIDAIESLREARLLEATVARRLANVPEAVRRSWYAARDGYNDTLAAAGMLRAIAGVRAPLGLHAFASRELTTQLTALGIEESAEEITVDIGRSTLLPEVLASLDPLSGSVTPRRVSLLDLACQNIGRFSVETLLAKNAQGASLSDRLGPAAIRSMVRDLDLANRYQAHLEQHLRQGSSGAFARKLAMAVQAARMRLEAADARLSYYLPGEPRSFIDDRDERGFRWVEATLGAPAGERRVDGHAIAVFQMTYRQVPLEGILVFAARSANSVPRVVLYTPDAPDGLTYREFASRQDAAKQLFYHPAFREYLLDRLPAEFATVLPNGTSRRFAGDHLAHWVLGASGDAAYTLTAEPFDEREVRDDFLAASYDATIGKYRRDTRFLARSTASADSDALFGLLQDRFNVDPAANLAATVLAEIPASLARLTQASWRFYDHVKAGDTGQAFVAFTEGYVNALNLIVPPFVAGRPVAAAIVRSRSSSTGVASTGVRLAPPRARFDDRYVAHGLRKAGNADHEGIFHVRGQSYIEHDGTHFLVRRDVDYDRWRLAPPQGALDARFTGPLIERVDGRWVYANEVGLRGGMRRLRRQLNRISTRDNAVPPAAAGGDAAAQGAAAVAQRQQLPAHLEHLRAEALAAQSDNPSAIVLLRNDGDYVKVVVESRSAVIIDPLVHPDIAALSAHQRRVFLHELDTRFPLAGERAEVLDIAAWAQQDGRRIPSPPHSPGAAAGTDIQSPSISSSSGDPLPSPPILAAHQQARWDEALTAARSAPRSPRQTTPGSNAPLMENLLATEVVPREAWPEHLWVFSDREFQLAPQDRTIALGTDFSSWARLSAGTRSYPVSLLPPETPTNLLTEVLDISPLQQTGGRDPLGHWMQIDPLRHPPYIRANFEMRRRLLPSGEYQYSLVNHPASPAIFPILDRDLIIRTGTRAPLAPHRP